MIKMKSKQSNEKFTCKQCGEIKDGLDISKDGFCSFACRRKYLANKELREGICGWIIVKITENRVDLLFPMIKDKTVLEIGCVGMGENDVLGGIDFIHERACQVAKKVVGLDINEQGAQKMINAGYDIRVHSADELFDLNEKFDVVLAEEVIEHLQDLRTFCNNIKNHVKDNGKIIISSPNPQAIKFFFQQFMFGKNLINLHHTHWHSMETMKYLLESNGIEIVDTFIIEAKARNLRGRLFQELFRFFPNRFGGNIFYICKLKMVWFYENLCSNANI